jgi:hypothetical protein
VADFGLADLDESFDDTWHYLGKCFGATWPSHGLPHGTPLLALVC